MMRYQSEPYALCSFDLDAMMAGHWDETEAFNDLAELNVDHDKFTRLDLLGYLLTVTARDADGRLRGVAVWLLFDDPKHKGTRAASAAHFFVHPDARGHMTASRLITESQAILRRIGVKMMGICVKNQDEFMPLVKRHGFDRPQTTWYKWIGD